MCGAENMACRYYGSHFPSDNQNKMTAKADLRAPRRPSDARPASVVYAISQLLITQLSPFFDEDGAAIPEARDDFVVGYALQMSELVLARRQYFAGFRGGLSKDDPNSIAKLVLDDLFGQRDRAQVLQLWSEISQSPTQGSMAGQRCAERDLRRLDHDEVPMGLRARIHQKLILSGTP